MNVFSFVQWNKYFHICNDKWMKESIPDDWTKYIILTMPKKGDIIKCENYRTISLINHSSKILLEIIRSRMKPYVEAILAEEQAGFRPGRSTVEQVFASKMLIQHCIEEKDGKVFTVFIDYKKAFDRVCMMACFLFYSSMVSLENPSTSSGISTARPKAALEWTTISLTGLKQQ